MRGQHSIKTVSIPENFFAEPILALAELAKGYGLRWLLAHADDGVIWGELRAGVLCLSSSVFPYFSPPLRALTLQQTRLFGPRSEILLWRDNGHLRARIIQDGIGEEQDYYDEFHLLWGTEVEERKNGFALLREGREGLRHAPPLPDNAQPPISLKVRHYVAYDADGQAYIAYSRLVGFESQGGAE
ncbi:MAG: CRISPR-associated protein Csx19 [Thermanaerothrix sp.]|nr:CRISPR-associated protein Csx19 [Thermanaerothrix sp.]